MKEAHVEYTIRKTFRVDSASDEIYQQALNIFSGFYTKDDIYEMEVEIYDVEGT